VADSRPTGKVITVRGEVDPEVLGAVLMHEHLYCSHLDEKEMPTRPERVQLLVDYAVPNLRKLHTYGSHALCDATPPPCRAWPDTYVQISEASDLHVILATGFYREIEVGTYHWVTGEENAIWPFIRKNAVEELAAMCIREIAEGIHGTSVRSGCIKLGSSDSQLTAAERKAFKAGAIAQQATGVCITTHCPWKGQEAHVSQLGALTEDGVDPTRVVIGHIEGRFVSEWESIREWMLRGASFILTGLRMDNDWEAITELVDAIRDCFQEGLGDRLMLGLDYAFETEQGPFLPCTFMPPPPFVYMFTHVLPRFRKLGLEEEAIRQMLVTSPMRVLAVA
jgi:phosphotriesterase-related protein